MEMDKLLVKFGTFLIICLTGYALCGQEAFICRGNYYLALTDGPGFTTVYEVSIDPGTGKAVFDPLSVGTSGTDFNAMGYRYSDNYIYGVNSGNLELYRLGTDGVAHTLKAPGFNPYFLYVAGDVSPDGKNLVVVGTNPFQDEVLVFIDLASKNFEYRELKLSGLDVRCADIAFDPIDGRLYGFDGIHHRLVIYDTHTGEVKSDFPPTSKAVLMGGLFFDPFGNLFGYGLLPGENAQQAFFSIDKFTGAVELETIGPPASRNDGCSCPYTIGLRESVDPVEVIACTEVPVIIEIANTSGEEQKGLRLEQTFPESFVIIDIDNPLGGNLVAGGPGANSFTIEELSVPLGKHEVIITLELQADARGSYELQATLSGLPKMLGEVVVSDNPLTLVQDDSTAISVKGLTVDFSEVNTQICTGEGIVLDPGIRGFSFLWSDGSTGPTLTVTQGGTYSVTVSSGCETVENTFTVDGIGFQVELGPDLQIELGEGLSIRPEITPPSSELTFSWTSSGGAVPCAECFEPFVEPHFDTWYFLTASDAAGCFVTDSVLVEVIKDRNVFIPDAFSPNGDGINDYFYLQSKQPLAVLDFKVFDRWGNLLFENADFYTNDFSQGWNGLFKGTPLNGGVFFYTAIVRFLDDVEMEFKGEVSIVR